MTHMSKQNPSCKDKYIWSPNNLYIFSKIITLSLFSDYYSAFRINRYWDIYVQSLPIQKKNVFAKKYISWMLTFSFSFSYWQTGFVPQDNFKTFINSLAMLLKDICWKLFYGLVEKSHETFLLKESTVSLLHNARLRNYNSNWKLKSFRSAIKCEITK